MRRTAAVVQRKEKRVGGGNRATGPGAAERDTSKGKSQEGKGSSRHGDIARRNTDSQRGETSEAACRTTLGPTGKKTAREERTRKRVTDLWEEENPEGKKLKSVLGLEVLGKHQGWL